MYYHSTRDNNVQFPSAQTIIQGISDEGGLFIPNSFPKLQQDDINELVHKNYMERACFILSKFLTDFTNDEIQYAVSSAYDANKFDCDSIANLVSLSESVHMLELWHGPTCAFKDIALQLLPYLMSISAKKVLSNKEIVILVATSGDTGKAALEGFKDVEGTKIIVFYPNQGVSSMQERQMVTQKGKNVDVVAIQGNFDDAQTGVKQIFTSRECKNRLNENHMIFSSANSINWGRLVPQIVYYFSAYCNLIQQGKIKNGAPIYVAVPTGNFGNILAAFYAMQMGLPIQKFLCASNENHILTDFLQTGVYNRNRDFYATLSPSMDILISSNLERMLYHLSDSDSELIGRLYHDLANDGNFRISDRLMRRFQDLFYAGYCTDEQTRQTIHSIFQKYHYLCDTHTAVAVSVHQKYMEDTNDRTPTVIASTASPYKFSQSVLEALRFGVKGDSFTLMEHLSNHTNTPIPTSLKALQNQEVRFHRLINKNEMWDSVVSFLNIR